MKKVRKAVFPVGGLGKRFYPVTRVIPKEMLVIIDKPLIHYAFQEALEAGIEEFIFITRHGKGSIEDYFDGIGIKEFGVDPGSICYVRQSEPKGLGHAVLCAKNLIKDEPFAVICADDFIFSAKSCIGEMIKNYRGANMVASMEVQKTEVNKYGILDIEKDEKHIIIAKSVEEKPSIETAKSCHAVIGRYVLSSKIFDILSDLAPGFGGEIQLTDALLTMISSTGLEGFKFEGRRFDCGSKVGFLEAVLYMSASSDKNLKNVMLKFLKDNENSADGNRT